MKVKICGITHPKDAEYAALLGADFIGMVFHQQSRRNVSIDTAKGIVNASIGANPVGVFVNQTADEIRSICERTGLHTIQLHGILAKQALSELIDDYCIIYGVPVEKNGAILEQPKVRKSVTCLYDNSIAGTGVTFEWKTFIPPQNSTWMLAGGLNPNNVAEAIRLLKPNGVDVATGVEFHGSTRKDPLLLKNFIKEAKKEYL